MAKRHTLAEVGFGENEDIAHVQPFTMMPSSDTGSPRATARSCCMSTFWPETMIPVGPLSFTFPSKDCGHADGAGAFRYDFIFQKQ